MIELLENNVNVKDFVEKCLEYNKLNNVDMTQFEICPAYIWASYYNKQCHDVHSGTENCKLCGEAVCPVCGNHNVTQISRVTGYMGDVKGWNNAKKQELLDRKRYNI